MNNVSQPVSIWRDPHFFRVTDFVELDPQVFELAHNIKFYIIRFTGGLVEDPGIEPIGVFSYAGIRRFIWRDKFWSEYCLNAADATQRVSLLLVNCRDRQKAIDMRRILDLLKLFRNCQAPNPESYGIESATRGTFCRVIYEIA